MMEEANDITKGKVIFWNGAFGFIQTDSEQTLFFHRSNINRDNKKSIQLLDIVSFQVQCIQEGKHQGSTVASNVSFCNRGNLKDYTLFIGRLTEWNGRSGNIYSPQQDKKVVFFETRKLNRDDTFENGGMVVFHQVKSILIPNQLFALFAYPLKKDKDIDFLRQQYQDSQQEEIKYHIDNILASSSSLSPKKRFRIELQILGHIKDNTSYLKLVETIKQYKHQDFIPDYHQLKHYCSEVYLLQLWESGLVKGFDLELVKQYFYKATSDAKRSLILKLPENSRHEVLFTYFQNLLQENKIHQLNNHVKTLLDIVYRNPKSREEGVYLTIKEYFLNILKPEELINLWLGGYIDELSDELILDYIDVDNQEQLRVLQSKNNEKLSNALKNVFEQYFVKITDVDFEQELPRLVNRLHIFESELKGRIADVEYRLSDYQRFLLWIFRVSITFDAQAYFQKNFLNQNQFYRLLYFNHPITNPSDPGTAELLSLAIITQEGLEDFIEVYNWNNSISPTEKAPQADTIEISFLPEVEAFITKYSVPYIDLEKLAIKLYNAIPKYTIHHLRLWLYKWVDNTFYDYVGFRNVFKQLEPYEQKRFKEIGDSHIINEEVTQPELAVVEPCVDVLAKSDDFTEYAARLFNIYFDNGEITLRKEDKSYTQRTTVPLASTGMNRIPKSHILNQRTIYISY